eukprot:275405_1
MISRKCDKDKRTNYEDYRSGINSAISDLNVTHQQSITDRYNSMGVRKNSVQHKGLEKRTVLGEKRKQYQGRKDVEANRAAKRHKKHNVDNTYNSTNHTE